VRKGSERQAEAVPTLAKIWACLENRRKSVEKWQKSFILKLKN
jgi:hypothetical protein